MDGFEAGLFARDLTRLGCVRAVPIEPHDWLPPGRRTRRPRAGRAQAAPVDQSMIDLS